MITVEEEMTGKIDNMIEISLNSVVPFQVYDFCLLRRPLKVRYLMRWQLNKD